MAEQVRLSAERRTVLGKRVRQLRRQGKLPGNIYGGHRDSIAVQVNGHDFGRMLETHANTTLIQLAFAGNVPPETVLVAHVQHDPATGAMQHVDFRHVEMSQPVRAAVPVHLIGEAPVVKLQDAILVRPVEAVEVEALPRDLPAALEVDISGLTDLSGSITVGDLTPPRGVTILSDPSTVLVTATPPRVAAEEVEAPAAAEQPAAGVQPAAPEAPEQPER